MDLASYPLKNISSPSCSVDKEKHCCERAKATQVEKIPPSIP